MRAFVVVALVGILAVPAIGQAVAAPVSPELTWGEPAVPAKVPEWAAADLEKLFADVMKQPDAYSGAWFDGETESVVVGIPSAVDADSSNVTSASILDRLDLDRQPSISIQGRTAGQLMRAADAAIREPLESGRLMSVSVDWEGNGLSVGVSPNNLKTQLALERTKFSPLLTGVRVGVPAYQNSGPGRDYDRYPYTGAADVSSAPYGVPLRVNKCSTGFAMKRPDGSKHFMLTAGHCTSSYPGNTPVIDAYTLDLSNNPTVLLGTSVGYGNSLCSSTGESCYQGGARYGDVGVYRVSGNEAKIWSGTATTNVKATVVSTQTGLPAVGDTMCFDGSTSGKRCNLYITDNYTYYLESGNLYRGPVVRALAAINKCSQVGDSGGAVYKPTTGGVRASGIVSGSNPNNGIGSCEFYYTSIYYAQQLFNVQTVLP